MSEQPLATVDPLPGREWGAKAAAGDAMQRAPTNAPFVAMWLDDGELRYSKANTTIGDLAFLSAALQRMVMQAMDAEGDD